MSGQALAASFGLGGLSPSGGTAAKAEREPAEVPGASRPRVMVVGPSGSGKSTLLAALGRARPARKTEAIEIGDDAIDTPGEFFNIPWYYRILIQTSCKADVVLLIMDATSKGGYPPQFGAALRAPVVGAVTKADLATASEIEAARLRLVRAGAREVRIVSATAGTGLSELEEAILVLARRRQASGRR